MRNIVQYPISADEVRDFIDASWKPEGNVEDLVIGGNDGYIKYWLQKYFEDPANMEKLLETMRVRR